jgi:hypothetical protein
MIIGVLIALAIAWKIRDLELRLKEQATVVVKEPWGRSGDDDEWYRTVQFSETNRRWVCRVLCGADQVGHKPRGRARNKGEAWDMCRREGAWRGIPEHWWRKDHGNGRGACQWYAYKTPGRIQAARNHVLLQEISDERTTNA